MNLRDNVLRGTAPACPRCDGTGLTYSTCHCPGTCRCPEEPTHPCEASGCEAYADLLEREAVERVEMAAAVDVFRGFRAARRAA